MPIVDFTLADVKTVIDTAIDARFVKFELRYDADMTAIQQDFLGIYERFDRLETDVNVLKTDVNTLKTDVGVLKSDVSTLKSDVKILKTDVQTLKTDVRAIKHQSATRDKLLNRHSKDIMELRAHTT